MRKKKISSRQLFGLLFLLIFFLYMMTSAPPRTVYTKYTFDLIYQRSSQYSIYKYIRARHFLHRKQKLNAFHSRPDLSQIPRSSQHIPLNPRSCRLSSPISCRILNSCLGASCRCCRGVRPRRQLPRRPRPVPQ